MLSIAMWITQYFFSFSFYQTFSAAKFGSGFFKFCWLTREQLWRLRWLTPRRMEYIRKSIFACCTNWRSSALWTNFNQLDNSFPATLPSLCRERHNFSLVNQQSQIRILLLKRFDKEKERKKHCVIYIAIDNIYGKFIKKKSFILKNPYIYNLITLHFFS